MFINLSHFRSKALNPAINGSTEVWRSNTCNFQQSQTLRALDMFKNDFLRVDLECAASRAESCSKWVLSDGPRVPTRPS